MRSCLLLNRARNCAKTLLMPLVKVLTVHAKRPSNWANAPASTTKPAANAQRSFTQRLPNVWAKLSGLTSGLVPGAWSAEDLRPLVETALDAFGAGRLLYGSDWPLAELGGGAPAWRDAAGQLLGSLSRAERDAVFGGTAAEVYSLG